MFLFFFLFFFFPFFKNDFSSSLMASIRFKFEAIGFGLSEVKEEKKEADAANDGECSCGL